MADRSTASRLRSWKGPGSTGRRPSPEWVDWVDEPVPGYPKRPVARNETAAKELKARTLTNLYNARPQWLADAHASLDAAVAGAHGWDAGDFE